MHRLLTAAALSLRSYSLSHRQPPVIRQRPRPLTTSVKLATFESEGARAHCPKHQVVRLKARSGIYREKGMRWYGRTTYGGRFPTIKNQSADGDING